MSHLRPIQDLLDATNYEAIIGSIQGLENFGPELNRVNQTQTRGDDTIVVDGPPEPKNQISDEDKTNDDVGNVEEDLVRYQSKLTNYLNERPTGQDSELIYAPGKCHSTICR